MKIDLTTQDLFQDCDDPKNQMLIQAIAIISCLDKFREMQPSEIFDYIKNQAEVVAST
jgi:hypothetical protein